LKHFDRKDAANIPVDSEQWKILRSMLDTQPTLDPAIEA
jgi:hypothetical protein